MKKISTMAAVALTCSSLTSLSAASVEEFIKGTSIDGSSFFRYITNGGENDGGQGYIMRVLADINSGNIEGFTFNFGLFYHYGVTPLQGTTSDTATNGSRADRMLSGGGNVFGVSTLYANYEFESTKTQINGGKMRLATPISNKINDRAVGAIATNKDINGLTISLAYFDSWSADNQYIGGMFSAGGDGALADIGNNLAALGFTGDYSSVKFQLWYFNIDKVANTLFGEFSTGNKYQFKAQVAYTNMYQNATFKFSGSRNHHAFGGVEGASGAKSRGLYTLQLALNFMPEFATRMGFVGSFGSGYGVALNNEATFSKGGKWWFDNFVNGRNGFSLFGQGGIENTHLNLWYLAFTSKVSIVNIGLDIAGISGKNQYAVSTIEGINGKESGANIKNRTFFEVTPSVDVNITKQLTFSAYLAFVFGQIDAQRLWSQFSYKF